MKNKIHLICFEFRFLFRQKFLGLLILLGFALIIFRMPRFHYEFNYDVFEESFQNRTEAENATVDYWDTKRTEILEQRSSFVERAQKLQQKLTTEQRYEKEYFETIVKYYSKPITLETQDYLGWEMFFLHQTSMSPHSPVCLLGNIIIVSAGLLLLTKDRENQTLFGASITGKGAVFSAFLLKIITVFFYGIVVQVLFNSLYILWLWIVVGFDMRHYLHFIQNIRQFGMCDLQLSILQVLVLDIILKCVLSILLFLFVFLFATIMKRYLFLFMSSIALSGILYYLFYVTNNMKNYDMWWRINPFHIFQLDKALIYSVVNIRNHAVDARVIAAFLAMIVLIGLLAGSYQIWRRYLYAELCN